MLMTMVQEVRPADILMAVVLSRRSAGHTGPAREMCLLVAATNVPT
jgi:hypothetical protein